MSPLIVKSAVYGAFNHDTPDPSHVIDARAALQAALDQSTDGKVTINNNTMRHDPSFGVLKHFTAVVSDGATDHCYACGEGETIDFRSLFHFPAVFDQALKGAHLQP
jgi:hypothetical protein